MFRSVAFFAILVGAASMVRAQDPDDFTTDAAAVASAIESYLNAFNQGNADSLAAHWAENAEYLTTDGERLQGREAIRQVFADMFAGPDRPTAELLGSLVRIVSADVAIEEGSVRVTRPGEPAEDSSYIAVLVKEADGNWRLNTVRETSVPEEPVSPQTEQLQELEWLIGQWVDETDEGVVDSRFAWSKNQSFITGNFRVSVAGIDDLEGTQVIGWDAAAGTIRSWLFDSDGGFGEGIWTRDGDEWSIQFTQVLPDGQRATATNIYTFVDESTFRWRSTNRALGGEALPDVEEITVYRVEDVSAAARP